jgi:hypothetical protein
MRVSRALLRLVVVMAVRWKSCRFNVVGPYAVHTLVFVFSTRRWPEVVLCGQY